MGNNDSKAKLQKASIDFNASVSNFLSPTNANVPNKEKLEKSVGKESDISVESMRVVRSRLGEKISIKSIGEIAEAIHKKYNQAEIFTYDQSLYTAALFHTNLLEPKEKDYAKYNVVQNMLEDITITLKFNDQKHEEIQNLNRTVRSICKYNYDDQKSESTFRGRNILLTKTIRSCDDIKFFHKDNNTNNVFNPKASIVSIPIEEEKEIEVSKLDNQNNAVIIKDTAIKKNATKDYSEKVRLFNMFQLELKKKAKPKQPLYRKSAMTVLPFHQKIKNKKLEIPHQVSLLNFLKENLSPGIIITESNNFCVNKKEANLEKKNKAFYKVNIKELVSDTVREKAKKKQSSGKKQFSMKNSLVKKPHRRFISKFEYLLDVDQRYKSKLKKPLKTPKKDSFIKDEFEFSEDDDEDSLGFYNNFTQKDKENLVTKEDTITENNELYSQRSLSSPKEDSLIIINKDFDVSQSNSHSNNTKDKQSFLRKSIFPRKKQGI